MRSENVLFSAVQLLCVLLVLIVGGVFVATEYIPTLKYTVIMFIQRVDLLICGYMLIGVALFFGVLFYRLQSKSYFSLQMDGLQVVVEPKIIEDLVGKYWAGLFPDEDLNAQVVLRGYHQIELIAQMPQADLDRSEALLAQIEKELGLLLFSHLGYRRKLILTIGLK